LRTWKKSWYNRRYSRYTLKNGKSKMAVKCLWVMGNFYHFWVLRRRLNNPVSKLTGTESRKRTKRWPRLLMNVTGDHFRSYGYDTHPLFGILQLTEPARTNWLYTETRVTSSTCRNTLVVFDWTTITAITKLGKRKTVLWKFLYSLFTNTMEGKIIYVMLCTMYITHIIKWRRVTKKKIRKWKTKIWREDKKNLLKQK
jgi:hypothetical protein